MDIFGGGYFIETMNVPLAKYLKTIPTLLAALALTALFGCASAELENAETGTARADENGVFVDGKPFRFLSGEMHYFRIMPECWRDRLEKLRACGLNTVATYVPWNLHEPSEGKFDFDGRADLAAFLKLCDEYGLKVMLRPAPYICAEWDFGGLPAWLLKDRNINIRCSDEKYLEAVKKYYDKLFEIVKPFYCNNGGPIVAIQLENEYANFADDTKYIEFLRDYVLNTGFKGIIYSADPSPVFALTPLPVGGVWRTATCGGKLVATFKKMKRIQPDKPVMVSELWAGQGMRLKIPMRVRDYKATAAELDEFLSMGGHVSFYMFHGGTTFGLMNGAMRKTSAFAEFRPQISSYDVDALLNEAGDPMPKYFAFREVLLKYNPEAKKYAVPSASKKTVHSDVSFDSCASMRANIANLSSKTFESAVLPTMEDADCNYGFIFHSTKIRPQISDKNRLYLFGIRDRVWVNLDGEDIGNVGQNDPEPLFNVGIKKSGSVLQILAENQGRVNIGATMADNRKGVIGGVRVNNEFHYSWTTSTIPLSDISKLEWKPIAQIDKKSDYPMFFRGKFEAAEIADSYLTFGNFTRGYVWINGFLLGRYDKDSPLKTAYVPAQLVKKGANEIVLLECDAAVNPMLHFTNAPVGLVGDKIKVLKD